MSEQLTITLMSNDHEEIKVGMSTSASLRTPLWDELCTEKPANIFAEKEVAERSMLIKNMMEDLGEEALGVPVPIPNVSTAPSYE